MHKVALTPVLALAIGALLYTSKEQSKAPTQQPAPTKTTTPDAPKPFRPEWVPSPGPESILQGKLSDEVCRTPNCQGCALDKDMLFRKKPGHPKFQ